MKARHIVSVCLAVLALTGCAASPTEKAWQAMHLVDVAQTINGPAQDPCFEEGTATRFLIGDKPSTDSVLAWGAGIGVAHYAFDRWLTETGRADRPGWKLLRYIDVGYKGFTIGRNHELGVRPFGDNRCPTGL